MRKIFTGALILPLTIFFFAATAFSKPAANSASGAKTGASISGYVTDSESKETIIRATVSIKSLKTGAFSNKNGFYTIGGIPAGTYEISVSFVGYETIVEKITFKKDEEIRKTFELKQMAVKSETVNVQANRIEDKREISISKVIVPVEQIKNIKIGGESDVFRALQYLPGILTSSQISSALFVRGGSPDQNLVLVDGSTVYNPTHIFGFISTFNGDAMKDVELIKGGFPAEYGGRLSAVLNLTQKDGNQNKVTGNASIGVISSRASLEGPSPIKGGSWFVSARRTYFELIKGVLNEDKKNPLPDFGFYDINAKYSQQIGDNDKVFVSGFMSNDDFELGTYGVSMNLELGNKLISARWNHIFSPELFSTVNVSASKYLNRFDVDNSGYKSYMENSIIDYTAKVSLEWFADDNTTCSFGYEFSNYRFSLYSGSNDENNGEDGAIISIFPEDVNQSVYAQTNYQLVDDWSFQAGLRAGYWQMSDNVVIDPRLSAKYVVNPFITLKAATGIYHQSLRLMSVPDFQFFDTWLPTDKSAKVYRADHYIFTIETKPDENIDLNFDFYYKRMYGSGEMRRVTEKPETVSDVFYFGDSYSYGAEVFAQIRYKKLYGWAGYAIGWINNKFADLNYGKEYNPKYDRRHDLKVVLNYAIDDAWEVGGNFIFQSGQSYTVATSRFQSSLPGSTKGKGKWIYDEVFGNRLPPSHQLNLMVSKKMDFFGLESKLTLDVYNVYNHADIWFRYYDLDKPTATYEDVTLLPILPTLSFEVKF